MKPLLTLFLITLAVPVQTHILSLLPFPFPLDLVLITTYYYGYFHGKGKGMLAGAYLGILTDILSGELLGTQMFLKTLIGYFSAVFGFGIFSKDYPIHFLLLLVFSLANGFMNLFLINLFGGAIPLREALVSMILPAAGWNALIGSLFIFLAQKWELKLETLPSRERAD
jgi:rod shape-determining protein MreD